MRPAFTMLYLDSDYPTIIREEDNRRSWNFARRILQRANVGFLDLPKARHAWRFMFGNQSFCGRYVDGLRMGNVENLGLKIYVGNCENGRGVTTRYE
jgi:hypothetical protein